MARETLASLKGIVVEPVGEGLLADYCRQRGVSAIVKGLRSSSDFDYELPMATMNRQLSGVETVFLPAEAHYIHLSSTLIKEVAGLGGKRVRVRPQVRAAADADGRAASGSAGQGVGWTGTSAPPPARFESLWLFRLRWYVGHMFNRSSH